MTPPERRAFEKIQRTIGAVPSGPRPQVERGFFEAPPYIDHGLSLGIPVLHINPDDDVPPIPAEREEFLGEFADDDEVTK